MIYPEKNTSDKMVDGIRAGAQLIPFGIGGAISEIVNSFIPFGYEKRRDEWFRSIGMKIEKLPDETNILIKNYIESEEGKTLLIRATITAIETHKIEKLNYLSDVLLGVIEEEHMSYDKKEMFLSIISSLEPYDLLLLTIIKNEIIEFNLSDNFEAAYQVSVDHGFAGEKDEFAIIINKLKLNSLLRVSESIDSFSDVFSHVLIAANNESTLPKFLVTDFANQLVDYLKDTK